MSLKKPARQQVVDSIADRFKTIRIANGYRTDIGAKVYVWKVAPWDPKDLSGMIIRDTTCEIKGQVTQHHDWTLQIEVDALAVGERVSEASRNAEADILKCIGLTPRWTVEALSARMETTSINTEIAVRHEETLMGVVRFRFEVAFRTALFSPEVP